MAGEGAIPSWFGKLHPKYNTPANAILFCLAFSAAGPWFGRTALGWFVDMSSIGAAIGYGYTNICAFITMKRENELGQHKILATMSVLGTLFSLFFLVMLLGPGMPGCLSTPSYILLFVWIFMGIAFYKAKNRKEG